MSRPSSSSSSFRFATPDEIQARLARRFPNLDADVLADFSYAVSINRYSYADAKKMLTELVTVSSVERAMVDAIEEEKEKEMAKQAAKKQRYEEEYREQQRRYEEAASRHRGGGGTSDDPASSSSSAVKPIASAMLHSTVAPDDEIRAAGFHESEAILYITSMTNSQQVRDHCRLLHQLLFIRRIRHTQLDIADNMFLQKRLQKIVASSSSASPQITLPMLFIGESFIGDYERCQRLEDEGLLLPAMQAHGFVYVPEPLPQGHATRITKTAQPRNDDDSDREPKWGDEEDDD